MFLPARSVCWLGTLRHFSLLILLFARELVVCGRPWTETLRYADSTAIIWYVYLDPVRMLPEPANLIVGWYDVRSNKPSPESGTLVHARTAQNEKHGCTPIVNAPFEIKWISLIERGACNFQEKILNARAANASAVIVYNHVGDSGPFRMQHSVDGIVTVSIHREDGERLASLTDRTGGTNHVNISSATLYTRDQLTAWGLTLAAEPTPEPPPHLARFVVFVVPAVFVMLPIAVFLIYKYAWRQNACNIFSFARYERQEDEAISTDHAL